MGGFGAYLLQGKGTEEHWVSCVWSSLLALFELAGHDAHCPCTSVFKYVSYLWVRGASSHNVLPETPPLPIYLCEGRCVKNLCVGFWGGEGGLLALELVYGLRGLSPIKP